MTKFKESKGFAFIYYGSEDDALYVKKTLDRTAILKDKIRITRTVISENLSKMMFKLKTHGLSDKDVLENEAKYFNDENLEKEVERIIKPIFGTNVEVNKITIPHSKADKKPLRYARVFFYVSDVK
jgi:RNA recognition motif-containing protein